MANTGSNFHHLKVDEMLARRFQMTITGDIFPTYTDLTQQLTLFDPRNVTDQAPGLSPLNLLVHPKLSQTNPWVKGARLG